LLLDVSRHSVLLVTVPAFSVDHRSTIAAAQQSICDGASALIANVSHEKAPSFRYPY
jgi:hypothetical protein